MIFHKKNEYISKGPEIVQKGKCKTFGSVQIYIMWDLCLKRTDCKDERGYQLWCLQSG